MRRVNNIVTPALVSPKPGDCFSIRGTTLVFVATAPKQMYKFYLIDPKDHTGKHSLRIFQQRHVMQMKKVTIPKEAIPLYIQKLIGAK